MRLMATARLAVAASVCVVTACSAPGTVSNPRPDQTLLTHHEIMSVQGARDLYEVVQRLRPRWIEVDKRAVRQNISGTNLGVLVYQNRSYLGHIDVLHQLKPDMVYRMHWLDAPTASATLPFAMSAGHVAGAIVIEPEPGPTGS